MSEENVEIVREFLNTWVEVDEGLADLDRLREFLAPGATFDTGGVFPTEAVGRSDLSLDEFLEFRAAWIEPYDDWSYGVETILDAGGNLVVATFTQRGKPRGSDSWVELRYGLGYAVEDGLITGSTMYPTLEEALEAAGLSE